jgi:hypothetical protein
MQQLADRTGTLDAERHLTEPSVATGSEPVASMRPLRRADWAGLSAIVAFSLVFVLRASVVIRGQRYFPLFDDGMISMTYARNLARGNGLVWNAGEAPVEGITNLLWTVLLAGAHLLPVEDRWLGLPIALAGVALVVASALLARRLAARIAPDSTWAPTIALWLVGLYYPLLFWTLRGMEVGLLTVLTLAVILLTLELDRAWTRSSAFWLAIVCAAGVATRPDFLLVPITAAVWAILQPRRRVALAVVLAGSALAATGALTVWRMAYYGSAVPNTYTVKVEGIALGLRLDRGLFVAVMTLAGGVVLAGLFAAIGAAANRAVRRPAALLGATFVVQLAYSTWVGGDAWEWMRYANRYVTIGVVPLLCLAAVGIDALRGRRGSVWMLRAAVVAVASAVVYLVAMRDAPLEDMTGVSLSPAFVLLLAAVACAVAAVALDRRALPAVAFASVLLSLFLPAASYWWLHGGAYVDRDAQATEFGMLLGEQTRPGAHVAVVAAGASIYNADRLGVDILGKSDPRIAELPPRTDVLFRPGHVKWDHRISIGEDRPDIVAQVWYETDEDRELLADLGYVCVSPRPGTVELMSPDVAWYARKGSPLVRWDAVVPDPAACL